MPPAATPPPPPPTPTPLPPTRSTGPCRTTTPTTTTARTRRGRATRPAAPTTSPSPTAGSRRFPTALTEMEATWLRSATKERPSTLQRRPTSRLLPQLDTSQLPPPTPFKLVVDHYSRRISPPPFL